MQMMQQQEMDTDGQMQNNGSAEGDQDDYYSNFARRVYFLADQESWPKEKTMRFFNDKPGFEKYYNNWKKKQLGIEDPLPTCVKRLMLDSHQRTEQKQRDEQAKQERKRQEEEKILMESQMKERQRRQQGTRKFNKFMEDQNTYQYRRIEKLKKSQFDEDSKSTYAPQISKTSRSMIENKIRNCENEEVADELAAPVHERLFNAQGKPQRQHIDSEILSPQRALGPESPVKSQRPLTAKPTFHPQISATSKQIIESKRRGTAFNSLVQDAERRKVQGKKIRMPKPNAADPEPANEKFAGNSKKSSSDLLMKRFEKDLFEVLRQFEIDEDTNISEVTVSRIMLCLGFISESNFDEEAVLSIWRNLQPVGGAEPESNDQGEEIDNGERVVVAHLKVFLAAILGFNVGIVARSSNPDPELIGTINDGDYLLSQLEVQKIHRRFKQLSQNRTDHVLLQRKQRQSERLNAQLEQSALSGRPFVNEKSQKIYDQMVKDNKVEVGQSYEDYLISRGRQYEQKRQERQEKKDNEDPEAQECTFQPRVMSATRKDGESVNMSSRHHGSGNKWQELYHQAERKQGKVDKTPDEIEFERNAHEMRFAPEVHEVNLRGSKKPIKSKATRQRGTRQMGNFLMSAEQDRQEMDDGELVMENLQIGASFEDNMMHSARSNRRAAEGDTECLDMELVIGNQNYVITIYPDSDPDALAHEFAAQHNLGGEMIDQLREQIQASHEANFAPQQ